MQTSKLVRCTRTTICKVSPKVSGNNKNYMNKAKKVFDEYAKKRTEVAKENINKVVTISQGEIKELTALINELDTIHRTSFEEFRDMLKQKVEKIKEEANHSKDVHENNDDKDDKEDKKTEIKDVNIFLDD
jgi:hypothetical protein